MRPKDDWKESILKEEIEHLKSFIDQTKDDPEQHEGFKMILEDVRIWLKEIGKVTHPDKDTLEWRIDYLEEELKMLNDILEDQNERGEDTDDLEEEISTYHSWISEMRSQIRSLQARS